MGIELQAKLEKYEIKAARCEEKVRQITDGPQRAFYEVLAHYYSRVARDFRQINDKRNAA